MSRKPYPQQPVKKPDPWQAPQIIAPTPEPKAPPTQEEIQYQNLTQEPRTK